jgi:ATP-dependent DNA helicase DinG
VLATTEPGWVRRLPDSALDVLHVWRARPPRRSTRSPAGCPTCRTTTWSSPGATAPDGLTAVAEAASEIREPSVSSAVYAVADGSTTRLRVSPLRVGGALASRLFGDTTVVATSATLTLAGSFRHTASRLGLTWLAGSAVGEDPPEVRDREAVAEVLDGEDDDPPPPWKHLDVGSPFDYPRQGQLWVAADLPDPGRSSAPWAAAVDELLVELVTAAGGRTLGLFSSTAAAARAAAAVRAATDLPVLLQGDDSPGALQHRFAADARTCLFGTRSFWQGVDTPGSACQLVVIDRIPFGYVDDPLSKAQLAAAADAGRNGFLEVTLPPAAVLLAQGAGPARAVHDDRGVVAVLDPRLATARYGALLLDTLPGFYRARSKDAVLASLRAIDASAPPVAPVGAPPAERRRAAAAAAG